MDIVFRAAAIFAAIFLIMRVIGRRELASMQPFDLILLVVMGDLIQQGFLQRTPRGRLLTPHAFAHLGLAAPSRPAQFGLFVEEGE